MAEVTIKDKFKLYLSLHKEIAEFRKKQNEQKKVLQTLEQDIQEYMLSNAMTTISLNEGDIICHEKKTNQGMKKPAIIDKITEKLKCNQQKAEELAESILTNKIFVSEPKIKVSLKKIKK